MRLTEVGRRYPALFVVQSRIRYQRRYQQNSAKKALIIFFLIFG